MKESEWELATGSKRRGGRKKSEQRKVSGSEEKIKSNDNDFSWMGPNTKYHHHTAYTAAAALRCFSFIDLF